MYTSEYSIIIHMYDILSWLFIYIMGCDWSGNLLLNIFCLSFNAIVIE